MKAFVEKNLLNGSNDAIFFYFSQKCFQKAPISGLSKVRTVWQMVQEGIYAVVQPNFENIAAYGTIPNNAVFLNISTYHTV